ncbi:MarR family transcriptional regulator [Rhodobacteraceae bacterium WD3A24]|nr:MarR family transcriptional regulator [Rhodobacteraceae bacterium WD3A24]
MTRTIPRPPASMEDVALDRLSGSLGFLLRLAQVQVFEAFFEDLGQYGLRPGEFSVLYVIHLNPGIRQGLLAQRLRIKRAHMTKMIRNFEERGLIARRTPDDDRRAIELRLTPEGEGFVSAHAEAFFSHDARRPTPLDPKEQAQLFALLQKYVGLTPETTP